MLHLSVFFLNRVYDYWVARSERKVRFNFACEALIANISNDLDFLNSTYSFYGNEQFELSSPLPIQYAADIYFFRTDIQAGIVSYYSTLSIIKDKMKRGQSYTEEASKARKAGYEIWEALSTPVGSACEHK